MLSIWRNVELLVAYGPLKYRRVIALTGHGMRRRISGLLLLLVGQR